jgi:ribosomal protein S18 acetylase RimI-like enzyme
MDQLIEPALNAPDVSDAAHPLDNPVWGALTTRHSGLAEGSSEAWRYPAQIAPFAATADNSTERFAALERFIATEEDYIALVLTSPAVPPSPFESVLAISVDQMVLTSAFHATPFAELVTLGAEDVPEMMALVELTKPGPFGVRTRELGNYIGIRDGNRLVAMAGERMRLDGFTEISAVCTHPDYRGRGFARVLITRLAQAVSARGETPFLHVASENSTAIALYRELGFTLRQTMHFMVLRRSR